MKKNFQKYFALASIPLVSLVFLSSAMIPMLASAQTCVDQFTGASVDCSSANATAAPNTGSENVPNTTGGQNVTNTSGQNVTNSSSGQNVTNTTGGQLVNPLGSSATNSIPCFVYSVYKAFLVLLTGVLALFIIYSGYLFVAARGNGTKITAAKTNLYYVLIGGALILGAWTLAGVISSTVSSIAGGSGSSLSGPSC